MATLKDEALAYIPKQTKNIADLEKFDISEPTEQRTGTDDKDAEYNYYVLIRDEEKYRIPNGVMDTIKNLIEASAKHNKELKYLSVEKKGEGMKSRYSVITLED
jgi:hypothetical protein